MTTWTQMKFSVEQQMHSDPQRATLSTRAWQQVEEGLRHLQAIGHSFEIVPRGTLAELVEIKESGPTTLPLTIADAVEQIVGSAPPNPMASKFEAMTRGDG